MEIQISEWLEFFVNNNPLLVNIASLLTALAVVIAPLSYVIKISWSKRTEKTTISRTLCEELENAMKALDGRAKRKVMEIKIGEKKRYYTLTFMNYDIYDSLIFSGKIHTLDIRLQQSVQDIYRRIKGHQEYLKYAAQLMNSAKLQGINIDKTVLPYYRLVADYEEELDDMIPQVMKKLC